MAAGNGAANRKYVYRRPKGRTQERRPGKTTNSFSECQIKDKCGSCRYVNLDYEASLTEKYQAGIRVLAGANVISSARHIQPTGSPRELAYRSVAKLAVRIKAGAPREERFAIGLFQPNSHNVVEVGNCPLHVPAIGRFIRALTFELNRSELEPWDEKTGQGDLRYIVVRSAHLTNELMVTFVMSAPRREMLKQIVSQMRLQEHKINSAHMNINAEASNAIFGAETIHIAGGDKLRESICDLKFEISPTAFFQVNPWQAINLYRRVEQLAGLASPGDFAWDLYCGGGQIAMMLARLGYKVFGIEENPSAIVDAKANAKRNSYDQQIDFLAGKVEDMQSEIPKSAAFPSLIVVNPSRRGIAKETRDHIRFILANSPRTRLVYVSCEVETLARDLVDLTASGHAVRQVEAFDMFAQTDKLEWLAILTH